MRQAATTIMVGLCLVLAPWARGGTTAEAAGEGPIPRARRLIEAGDHVAALTVLEDALIEANAADRPALIELLHQSYEVLARKAEAGGRTREAAHYRDNLAILDRSRPPRPVATQPSTPPPARPKATPEIPRKPPAPTTPMPTPAPSQVPTPPILAEPAPLPEPERIPPPKAPARRIASTTGPDAHATRDPDVRPLPAIEGPMLAGPEPDRDGGHASRPSDDPDRSDAADTEINPGSATPEVAPGNPSDSEAPARERPAADSDLDRADHLFVAGQYDEAGRVYATLAGQDRLPADRRPHWAYCRAKEVCRKINGRPRSSAEWDAIEAEVRAIRQLTPGHWIGEYLRNKVAEERGGGRRAAAARSDKLIIRGSEPEEPKAPARRLRRPFTRPREAASPQPDETSAAPRPAPAPDGPLNLAGPDSGSEPYLAFNDPPKPSRPARDDATTPAPIEWQALETENFRIFHCDLATARRAAEIAESVRKAQAGRWKSPAATSSWTPRCELYLHPNPKSYAEATGQPEVSPGISTMANDGTRVVSRRMNLRADNPTMLSATLPHEVTHIVLADVFVARQIPRWADEGLAVLAEPTAEQRNRVADLRRPLEAGQVFPVSDLMKMDYPDQKDWRLFYAQSVSLTRFLVDQGPPERFLQFVRDAQRTGADAAVRDVYQIDGLDALHDRWLAHARKQVAVETASSRDADSTAPSTTR